MSKTSKTSKVQTASKLMDSMRLSMETLAETLVQEISNLLESRDLLTEEVSDTLEYYKSHSLPKASVVKAKKTPAEKRKPSAYNLYIKDKIKELKEARPELKGSDLMREAVAEYKKEKAAGAVAPVTKSSSDDDAVAVDRLNKYVVHDSDEEELD